MKFYDPNETHEKTSEIWEEENDETCRKTENINLGLNLKSNMIFILFFSFFSSS